MEYNPIRPVDVRVTLDVAQSLFFALDSILGDAANLSDEDLLLCKAHLGNLLRAHDAVKRAMEGQ